MSPEAPPEARVLQHNIVLSQIAEAKRVRGMRLLVQGEFESETGGLARAARLLEESIETMRAAEGEGPADGTLEPGLHFIDFAKALLHKTQSDAALLAGDLTGAAGHQEERAAALERCQSIHARAARPLNEGFARRLARDAYVARQKHDRLSAEAEKLPKSEWRKAAAFFLMAIGSATLFLWLTAQFDLTNSPGALGLLLAFVMAVAGVGARLVNWKEAADWLRLAKGAEGGKSAT